jgi:hypothetical protein
VTSNNVELAKKLLTQPNGSFIVTDITPQIDGVKTKFKLDNYIDNAYVFLNGLKLLNTVDYVITGTTLTTQAILQTTDDLLVIEAI